ncbi:MAG TPA: AMP-binding protein [Terriglobales bacterium]|nr:AMP-binding protein [Terriglobales bacterium]
MQSFYSRFLDCAARFPQAIAVEIQRRDAVESHTYSELRRMAEFVGGWLRDKQLPAGARCAFLASNSPRWVAAYLGTLAAGGTAVPLDTAFHSDQIRKLLEDSGSTYLFTEEKFLKAAQEAVAGLPITMVLLDKCKNAEACTSHLADLDVMFTAGPGDFTPVQADAEDVAAILYTSGTTSDPKGVMLTQANLVGEIECVFAALKVGPSDAILGILPLFHALAQMANLLLPLVIGARVVYLESLNTSELLRALQERRITLFCCVPQFFYLIHERIQKEVAQRGALARAAVSTLMRITTALRGAGINTGKMFFGRIHHLLGRDMRYLITGGSRFDPKIAADFYAFGFDILQAYGLTETTGGACCTLPDDNVLGSVGKPFPGVEVKILNAREQESGPASGEIAIRGPIVMKGYYNRPDATAAVLKDGWLHTGDLGYLDSGGHVFITGRAKDVIVLASGKNIYPEEIEAHYAKTPYVKEICVMGLRSRPGEPFSERLHAVVVPNFELLRQRKIVNAKEVLRFDIEGLSAQVPSTKRILSYDIWQEDLPRTTTRKLKRFEIERRVEQMHAADKADSSAEVSARQLSQEEQDWLAQPEVQSALKVIAESTHRNTENVRPIDNLELDLGLDSMQRVELLVAVETALGAALDESLASEVYTVRELVDAVRQKVAAAGTKSAETHQPVGWKEVLQTDPTDLEALAVTEPRPFMMRFWFMVARLIHIFARDFFRLKVTGVEKLPQHGPCIIAPNHQSYFDPPVVISNFPWRVFEQGFVIGTSEVFGTGFMRRLARSLKLVPVDPDANLLLGMKAAAYGLRHGRILLLYPEGERSLDGSPKTFKKGVAILSIHLQVPIYPVAIEGFFEAWPRGKSFQRFAPLKVAFGDPIYPPPAEQASEAAYEQLTAQLKSRIIEMWQDLHEQQLRDELSLNPSSAKQAHPAD